MEPKKTKGRQKIEMKRIQNEDDRLITFSKRRSGIYKKASELVTLTGAEVAFVVFSPAGKPFSFAHPSIDSLINRFLGQEQEETDSIHPIVEAHRQVRIDDLNVHHNELIQQLDEEVEKEKALKQKVKGKGIEGWWDTSIEELNVEELVEIEEAYKQLHIKVCTKIQQRSVSASTSCSQSHSQPSNLVATASNNTIDTPRFVPPNMGTINGVLFQ